MNVLFFETQEALRKWFQQNYLTETELFVAYYRKSTGKKSITWHQAVDEALCFGWIDGRAAKLDEESFCHRFTPRRPKSNWSDVNIRKIEKLIAEGKVTEKGKELYYNRDLRKQKTASFEQENVAFPGNYLQQFQANKIAWEYFSEQPPYYRKTATWYVISAKQETTRQRRLQILIDDCEQGIHIKPLRRNKPEKH